MSHPLRLIRPSEVPKTDISQRFRTITLSHFLGIGVCLAVFAFLAFFFSELRWSTVTPLGYVLIPLSLVIFTAIPGYIAWLLWAHVRAGMRTSNWIAQLTDQGVYLNLRSYLNWRLGESDRTVAFIPFRAIDCVYEVRSVLDVVLRVTPRRRYTAFVALRLRDGVDVDAVRQAVHGELLRVQSHPGFVRGSATWAEVPVHVRPDGAIWIRRDTMALLRALARHVRREARVAEHPVYGPSLSESHAREVLLDVMYHGEWSNAQQLAQFGLSMEYDASLAYVRSLLAVEMKAAV